MNIYLLQCSITKWGDNYKVHKENVFSSLEMARKIGIKYLEEELRNYYNEYFDNLYDVITNHNLLYNGCHEDRFRENEIKLNI